MLKEAIVAEVRYFRGWSEAELEELLKRAESLPCNFSATQEEMTRERGWNHYFSDSVIAMEPPGPPEPEGPFARARVAVANYEYSDPGIVVGHFDPNVPLLGRRMLLELKVLGQHYLCGVVVGAVREEADDEETVFGFRYDTLEGHFEVGSEWFLLTKRHASGEVHFRVSAYWRTGHFPNWWSRLGFRLIGHRYQEKWHRRAHARLSLLAYHGSLLPPRPAEGRLVHTGPEVTFEMVRGTRPRGG